jgi:nucleotide-binding universal stress UspA family protein
MYTQILVPLDGSSLAEQVLPYARFIAKDLAIPVQLLKVINLNEVELTTKPNQGRYFDARLSRSMLSSRAYLTTIAQSFQQVQVGCSVHEGNPPEVLMDKAAADKRTLIVMATHGGTGVRRWLLGSVANKLLQKATNDMFLIRVTDEARTDGDATLKRVIIPLDGSLFAEQALPQIEELAKTIELEIVLLRVCVQQTLVTKHPYMPSMNDYFHHLGGEVYRYLARKVQQLKTSGLTNVEPMATCGYAADQIISTAAKTRDSFVAISTHGGSGMNRWALGSVTNSVVRHSRSPVLIIRGTSLHDRAKDGAQREYDHRNAGCYPLASTSVAANGIRDGGQSLRTASLGTSRASTKKTFPCWWST